MKSNSFKVFRQSKLRNTFKRIHQQKAETSSNNTVCPDQLFWPLWNNRCYHMLKLNTSTSVTRLQHGLALCETIRSALGKNSRATKQTF